MPGAGSLIAANWLYNVAPRRQHGDRHHAERDRVRESAGQCQRAVRCAPVQLAGQPQRLYGGGRGVARSADLYSKEPVVGASGPSSGVTVWPLLLNALMATKIRTVRGYPGTAGITLAMEWGEVAGHGRRRLGEPQGQQD
jgi:hypothetical protein